MSRGWPEFAESSNRVESSREVEKVSEGSSIADRDERLLSRSIYKNGGFCEFQYNIQKKGKAYWYFGGAMLRVLLRVLSSFWPNEATCESWSCVLIAYPLLLLFCVFAGTWLGIRNRASRLGGCGLGGSGANVQRIRSAKLSESVVISLAWPEHLIDQQIN